jgi:tRNA pseudouridine38-40 synthase
LQPNAISVQEMVNKAFSVVLNSKIDVMGAGRTDTGVHAKEMFAHFDYDSPFSIKTIIHKINSFLPKDIVVFSIIPVHEDAHARFDATKRTYEYHINSFKDVFTQEGSWYFHQDLDIDLMNEASKILLNHIDFECFSKVNTDVNTFDCTIFEAYWTRTIVKGESGNLENQKLLFTISANRFLRNMVRAIVGTLLNVGAKKITIADFEEIIKSKKREKAGFSVPAHGLYLTKIEYDYIK